MTGPVPTPGPGTPPGRPGVPRAAVAVLMVAVLAVGTLLGTIFARQPALAVPTEGWVDVGFARDMQAHHAQAVQLAVLIRDRSTDEEIRTVALDILLTQQNQIGQMAGWISTWGLPAASSATPMAWMSTGEHEHTASAADSGAAAGYAAMPGWVSSADLARLTAAEGTEAEVIFLELMIPHHEGGVEMAQYTADRARGPQVVALARSIVTFQQQELTVLQDLLAARQR